MASKKTPPRGTDETIQLTVRVPVRWLPLLDELAAKGSREGLALTRTDALRRALAVGIDAMRKRGAT
jgi:hypothetical protein